MSSIDEAVNRCRRDETRQILAGKRKAYEDTIRAETVAMLICAYCQEKDKSIDHDTLVEIYKRYRGIK